MSYEKDLLRISRNCPVSIIITLVNRTNVKSAINPSTLENIEAVSSEETQKGYHYQTIGCGSASFHDWMPYCCSGSSSSCSSGSCDKPVGCY